MKSKGDRNTLKKKLEHNGKNKQGFYFFSKMMWE